MINVCLSVMCVYSYVVSVVHVSVHVGVRFAIDANLNRGRSRVHACYSNAVLLF